jgi:hypothetical protein
MSNQTKNSTEVLKQSVTNQKMLQSLEVYLRKEIGNIVEEINQCKTEISNASNEKFHYKEMLEKRIEILTFRKDWVTTQQQSLIDELI